ncbi:hypothetical protein HY745_09470, partial [Candidatus Desantisbacteria bacterium]|nr:hypothetical protein [Candidatus Desantisbacteria bacterium]
MSKKSIFILGLVLFISAANNIFGFQVNIEIDDADSSKIRKVCKIDRLDIKSEENKDYKHWEISPILAARPGVEINIFHESHKTKISMYEKIDSTNFKLERTRFNNSVSGLSIKYLPGEDDIPKYGKVHNKSSLTYINEKPRQSFTIGHKSRDLHGNLENEIS